MHATNRSRELIVILALAAGLSAVPADAQHRPIQREGRTPPNTPDERGNQRIRPPHERDRWRLGVAVEELDVGVRVKSVERNSAASQAGLEAGDIIVTVGGYQVGRVGWQSYALDDELQKQADASGRVRLLVQNRRNNRLTNLDVRLQRGGEPANEPIIRGRALLPDDARLPRDAEIRVRLIRRNLLGSKTYAEMTQRVNEPAPVAFELRFDPQRVELDKEYELEIEILSRGRRIFSQQGRTPLRLDPPPQRLDVRLRAG